MTRVVQRLLLVILVLFVAQFSASDTVAESMVARQVTRAVGEEKFSLFGWHVRTLSGRVLDGLTPPPAASVESVEAVREFFALVEQRRELQRNRERTYVSALGNPDPTDLRAIDDQIAAVDRRQDELKPIVEQVIARQMEEMLARHGIRDRTLEVGFQTEWPFLEVSLTPGVFFSYERLPLLLVVAPRDEIRLITTIFVQPDLTVSDMEALEARVEAGGVAAVTTPIGGLAAYPTMIPHRPELKPNLVTIAHEWMHHYLTPRPLGMRYFSSYAMRTINETVCDIAGEEIADWVYATYYTPTAPPPAPPAAPSAQVTPPAPQRPDFYTRMREVRLHVEGLLKAGDVATAEAYMEDARQQFLADGYYVRKLNTAYLSFFGAYSGTGNPYEPKLRQLREQSGSLAHFLEIVSTITHEDDLDRLLAETTAAH